MLWASSGVLAPVGIRREVPPVGERPESGEECAPDPQFDVLLLSTGGAIAPEGPSGVLLRHHHHIGGRQPRAHHVITAVGEFFTLKFRHVSPAGRPVAIHSICVIIVKRL